MTICSAHFLDKSDIGNMGRRGRQAVLMAMGLTTVQHCRTLPGRRVLPSLQGIAAAGTQAALIIACGSGDKKGALHVFLGELYFTDGMEMY